MIIELCLMAFTIALIAWPVIWLRRIERREARDEFIGAIEKYLQDH